MPPGAVPGLPDFHARAGVPGHVRVLVLRLYWSGKAPGYPDTSHMRGLIKQTASWYKKASRGRHHLSARVTPWLKIGGGYANCGSRSAVGRALAAARGRGIGAGSFNRFMLVIPQCGSNSLGEMPGRVTWIMEPKASVSVLVHELGHNLGLDHANSDICLRGNRRITQGGKCSTQEYGDLWDAMGLSSRQFSVAVLKRLGWAGRTATANKNGTWTLRDAEHSGGLQGLRVRSGKVSYWLEYRTNPVALDKSPGTFAITGTPGLQIRLDTGARSLRILDASPGNPDDGLLYPDPDFVSVALPPGSSFTTPQRVRITLVSQTATTATVKVRRGKKATAPPAPVVESAVAATSSGYVSLGLQQPQSDGGQVVLGYQVTRTPGESRYVAAPGGKSKLQVPTNHQGAGTWTVRAVNQVGTSPPSAPIKEYAPKPSVAITSPAPGATVFGPAFAVTATTSPDPVGGSPIASVQVCLTSLGSCSTDSTAPYTFTVNAWDEGSDTLVATVTDEEGAKATASIPIVVAPSPPSVQVSAPSTVTAGVTFTATASAAPNPTTGSPVTDVEFSVLDATGQLVTSDYDDAAPYAAELWIPTPGTYTVQAVARDENGYASSPSTVTITASPAPGG